MQYVQIIVEGKVQGVFFRKYTLQEAVKLRLNGFVRNRKDGSVYIEACGLEQDIQDFIDWCHKGPKNAEVNAVKVSVIEPQKYLHFEIRSTE